MVKKWRIGIFTISLPYLTSNYGSFFQHWSLRRVLQRLGCDTFRLQRRSDNKKEGQLIQQSCYRVASILWHVIRQHKKFSNEIRLFSYWLRRTIRFHFDYSQLIGCLFEDGRQPPDVFVGGSDQMWNQEMFEQSQRATLGRVTYAASGDWKTISADTERVEDSRKALLTFSAVSLREKRGIHMLRGWGITQPIFHAMDPVFLQTKNQYLSLLPAKRLLKRPTLLVYFVNIRAAEEFSLSQWNAVAKELTVKLKIVGIQGLEQFLSMFKLAAPSPRDFLRYCRDADYIVTNSFHGTVFALIMNKPFVCLTQREQRGASQNTRCAELLSWLGLTGRYLPYNASSDEIVAQLQSSIDYETINQKVAQRREESLAWLENALANLHDA